MSMPVADSRRARIWSSSQPMNQTKLHTPAGVDHAEPILHVLRQRQACRPSVEGRRRSMPRSRGDAPVDLTPYRSRSCSLAADVARAARLRGVAERHALQGAAVVAGELLLLHTHEVLGVPVLFAHAVGALSEHIAEALSLRDHLSQLHHSVGVAEGQGEADVFLRNEAALEHLHGARDGVARGDRIHAHLVADEVGLGRPRSKLIV